VCTEKGFVIVYIVKIYSDLYDVTADTILYVYGKVRNDRNDTICMTCHRR